jgi:hypothetical protein
MREDATTKLAAADRHPGSSDPPKKPAALDHPSGRVEASDLALADSVLKAGKNMLANIFAIHDRFGPSISFHKARPSFKNRRKHSTSFATGFG